MAARLTEDSVMRRFKSPEALKKWREAFECHRMQIEAQERAHERKMMDWAVEHATSGPCIMCPDGKVRTVPPDRFKSRSYRIVI